MTCVRLIFRGQVFNYKRHLAYSPILIYRKIIESSLEDLNCTHVTKLAQEEAKKIEWMKNYFLRLLQRFFFSIHCLDSERLCNLGLKL